jgi:hypothetical protein
MTDKPFSRWEWRSKPCPDCNGCGGWGEGDDFEVCWNCDDGEIQYEVEIEMTTDEWEDYHRDLKIDQLLSARYGPGALRKLSINDYWIKP